MQNSSLRLILGAFPSTPIPALQAETGISPLEVRRQHLADKYLLNKYQMANYHTIDKITSLFRTAGSSDYLDKLQKKSLLVKSMSNLEKWTKKIKRPILTLL
jgi:hypothetical protein